MKSIAAKHAINYWVIQGDDDPWFVVGSEREADAWCNYDIHDCEMSKRSATPSEIAHIREWDSLPALLARSLEDLRCLARSNKEE